MFNKMRAKRLTVPSTKYASKHFYREGETNSRRKKKWGRKVGAVNKGPWSEVGTGLE